MKRILPRGRVFSLGHSNRSLEELLAILEESSVKTVADIRTNPASARYPQFERFALARSLRDRGIAYRWFRGLGGLQLSTKCDEEQTGLEEPWQRAYASYLNTEAARLVIDELKGLALSTTVCLLCAEREPKKCHRFLLCDRLAQNGLSIVHLLSVSESKEHVLSEEMVQKADGTFIYEKRQLTMKV